MNKIALVSINAGRSDTRSHWPHYGLVLLATVLRKNGFDASVFDQSFLNEPDDQFLERVAGYSPDICGISLYTTHVSRSLDFIQQLHAKNIQCKIIAGGPHVALYAQTLKENQPFFSAIVRGEAEQVIVDICTKVLAGKDLGILSPAPLEGELIPSGFSIGNRKFTHEMAADPTFERLSFQLFFLRCPRDFQQEDPVSKYRQVS